MGRYEFGPVVAKKAKAATGSSKTCVINIRMMTLYVHVAHQLCQVIH
jgi:hypothetical protein